MQYIYREREGKIKNKIEKDGVIIKRKIFYIRYKYTFFYK